MIVSFEDFTPPARFDSIPWSDVQIEESDTTTLSDLTIWTVIDTLALSPADADPAAPATRSFTTDQAADTVGLWYRITFFDSLANTSQPSTPVQDTGVLSAYATVEELAELLKVNAVTRRVALQRVLAAAAAEIDHEVGNLTPYVSPPALAVEVNLERAVEHWQQAQSPFGLIGAGGVETPAFATSNSWERHAVKLAPLKTVWGLA